MGIGSFAGGFASGLSNGLDLYLRKQQMDMAQQEAEQRARERDAQQRERDAELRKQRDLDAVTSATQEDALRIGTQQTPTALAGQQPIFDTKGVQDASAAITDSKRELRRAAESGGEQAQAELDALNAGQSATITPGAPKTYTVEDWKDAAIKRAGALGIAGSKQWREGLATDAARITYEQLQKHVANGDFEGFLNTVNRAPDGYKLQMLPDSYAGGFHAAYVKDGEQAKLNRDGSVTNGRYLGHYDSPQSLMADYASRVAGPEAWSKHYLGERAIQSRNDIAALRADSYGGGQRASSTNPVGGARPDPSIEDRAFKWLETATKGAPLAPDMAARFANHTKLLLENPANRGMPESQAYEIAYITVTKPETVKASVRSDQNGVPYMALAYRDPGAPEHSREYTLQSNIDEAAAGSWGLGKDRMAEAAQGWWSHLPEAKRAEFSEAVLNQDAAREAIRTKVPPENQPKALKDLEKIIRWSLMADPTLDPEVQRSAQSLQALRAADRKVLQDAYDEWQAAKGPWYMPTPRADMRRIQELEAKYNQLLQRYLRD